MKKNKMSDSHEWHSYYSLHTKKNDNKGKKKCDPQEKSTELQRLFATLYN